MSPLSSSAGFSPMLVAKARNSPPSVRVAEVSTVVARPKTCSRSSPATDSGATWAISPACSERLTHTTS